MAKMQITMLGCRGVGKTSLMTALYHQSLDIFDGTKLKLTPDANTKQTLDIRLKELKDFTNLNIFKVSGGIEGTQGEIKFVFNLFKRHPEKKLIEFIFQDYAGTYHERDRDTLKQYLAQSTVALIVIDTCAMKEKNGKHHDSINHPQSILELFQEAYQNLKSPKLVIFTLLKCETYLDNENQKESENELKKITMEKYQELISFFRSPSLFSKVDFEIVPVQTVGSVIFSRIEEKNGTPNFIYRKRNPALNDYNPQGAERVLRSLLKFLLQLHINQTRWWFGLDRVQNWLNLDSEIQQAIKQISSASTVYRYAGSSRKDSVHSPK